MNYAPDQLFLIILPPSHFTSIFFFFNDTATTEIYTLSLHDALPITRGAVSRAVLERLPHDAIVVNVSRGTLLDETALLAVLDASRVRGAALDVFAAEPLPAGHPFWRHARVLVSPHVAAVTARFWER